MSEPTPLTATNAARAMTLLVMASRVDPNLRSAVADVESYIAELQREIEGLRAVSEQQQQRAQLAEERVAALKGALEAKEREMLAEHSSAMQALLRWCAEDTPEDIRKGWEQESHEALRALAAGRPR